GVGQVQGPGGWSAAGAARAGARARDAAHVRQRVVTVVDDGERPGEAGADVEPVGARRRDGEVDAVVRAGALGLTAVEGAGVDADDLLVPYADLLAGVLDHLDGGGALVADEGAVRELVRAVAAVLGRREAAQLRGGRCNREKQQPDGCSDGQA